MREQNPPCSQMGLEEVLHDILVCFPAWPEVLGVDQAGLKSRDLPTSPHPIVL